MSPPTPTPTSAGSPPQLRPKATFDVEQLVAQNVSTTPSTCDRGGIYALLKAFGEATATASIDFTTIVDNTADASTGGIEVESFTGLDEKGPGAEGEALLTIDHSVIVDNTGYGVGGPRPGTPGVFPGGTGNIHVDVSYSDVFGNASGSFEPTLQVGSAPPVDPPALRQTANLSVVHCSSMRAPAIQPERALPLIDAGSFLRPAPAPHGFRRSPRVIDGDPTDRRSRTRVTTNSRHRLRGRRWDTICDDADN